MAKIAAKIVPVTFCKVTPLERKRLDPYTSELVNLGDEYILDSKKAQMLADMGEVEILEEDVTPPWGIKQVKHEEVQAKAAPQAKAGNV